MIASPVRQGASTATQTLNKGAAQSTAGIGDGTSGVDIDRGYVWCNRRGQWEGRQVCRTKCKSQCIERESHLPKAPAATPDETTTPTDAGRNISEGAVPIA
jgi:hypothetical protein